MKSFFMILLALLIIIPSQSGAQIPRTLSYQGVLTDSNGEPKPDDQYIFTFRLYDLENGGSPIWEEKEKTLSVKAGLFSTTLGDPTPFGPSVKFDKQYWLGIKVKREGEQEEQLSPRIPLTSVAYSMNSMRADTAMVSIVSVGDTTWQKNGSDIYRQTGNVGIGTTSPATRLHVVGGSDASLSNGSGFMLIGSESDLNLVIDHNEIIARNNGASSKLHLNRGSGNVVVDVLEIKGGNDASLSNGSGFMLIGSESDLNLVIDNNEIIARNNGVPSKLHLNRGSDNVVVDVLEITGGSDLAEPFEISDNSELAPGTVVVIDPENPGQLKQATEPYDKKVAGVISGAGGINPGLTLAQEGLLDRGQHVALTGKVYALASACSGAIEPGDLLTTSDLPGYAMKATDALRRQGAVIGKAMTNLKTGEGLVLVLVQPQ